MLAANVLHATRDLGESLAHCRGLLAPSGLLVAIEGMRPLGWLDLTFGLLPGWWRFGDGYRTEHPLVPPPVWRRALADAGYGEAEILEAGPGGVVLARGPAEVRPAAGLWVVWPGDGELSGALVRDLEDAGQRVVTPAVGAGGDREAWRDVFSGLPAGELTGAVHVGAVSGPGEEAPAPAFRAEVARVGSSALALTQGLQDAGVAPRSGLWFVTRGGQVLAGERGGELAGSVLWGLGRAAAQELRDLRCGFWTWTRRRRTGRRVGRGSSSGRTGGGGGLAGRPPADAAAGPVAARGGGCGWRRPSGSGARGPQLPGDRGPRGGGSGGWGLAARRGCGGGGSERPPAAGGGGGGGGGAAARRRGRRPGRDR